MSQDRVETSAAARDAALNVLAAYSREQSSERLSGSASSPRTPIGPEAAVAFTKGLSQRCQAALAIAETEASKRGVKLSLDETLPVFDEVSRVIAENTKSSDVTSAATAREKAEYLASAVLAHAERAVTTISSRLAGLTKFFDGSAQVLQIGKNGEELLAKTMKVAATAGLLGVASLSFATEAAAQHWNSAPSNAGTVTYQPSRHTHTWSAAQRITAVVLPTVAAAIAARTMNSTSIMPATTVTPSGIVVGNGSSNLMATNGLAATPFGTALHTNPAILGDAFSNKPSTEFIELAMKVATVNMRDPEAARINVIKANNIAERCYHNDPRARSCQAAYAGVKFDYSTGRHSLMLKSTEEYARTPIIFAVEEHGRLIIKDERLKHMVESEYHELTRTADMPRSPF